MYEAGATEAPRVAERVLRHVLFGAHAYGETMGSRKQVLDVKRADVVALHARLFVGPRLSVVAAGGADAKAMLAAIDDAFGGLSAGGTPPPRSRPVVAPASSARIVVVDRPGVEPAIAAGFVGPSAGARGLSMRRLPRSTCWQTPPSASSRRAFATSSRTCRG